MDPIKEQKCPACGAPMRFDPQTGALVCDYCGATADLSESSGANAPEQPAPAGDTIQGLDFGGLNAQATDPDAQALPIYNCVSCGAEVIAAAEQFSLTCPYCGNNIVLTNKITGKLRPEGVLPFRIDAKALPDAMNRFYRDKVLLPRNFFSESTMGKVTGVYLPFWVFSGTLSGALSYRAERSSTHRSGDYEVTDTDHYRLERDVSLDFENLPVDASGRVDDALTDSLEPFDLSEAKPFDPRYLAGFTADRFDREKDDMESRAKERMFSSASKVISAEVSREYDTVSRTGGSLEADLRARYLLFPLYLFDVAHGGKSYHFAVNGQTGKVVGEIPTDKAVSRRYFLLRAGAVALAVLLIAIAKYLLGR